MSFVDFWIYVPEKSNNSKRAILVFFAFFGNDSYGLDEILFLNKVLLFRSGSVWDTLLIGQTTNGVVKFWSDDRVPEGAMWVGPYKESWRLDESCGNLLDARSKEMLWQYLGERVGLYPAVDVLSLKGWWFRSTYLFVLLVKKKLKKMCLKTQVLVIKSARMNKNIYGVTSHVRVRSDRRAETEHFLTYLFKALRSLVFKYLNYISGIWGTGYKVKRCNSERGPPPLYKRLSRSPHTASIPIHPNALLKMYILEL